MAYKRIGDMLVAGGYLTEEKLKAGLAESRRTGKKLGETLVEMGFIRQSDLINVLENQLDVEYVDLQRMSLPKNLVSVIPRAIAKKYNVVPLASDANTVTIAIADPLNFVATDAVRTVTRRKVITRLADAQSITRALTDLYGSETAEKALEELRGDESAPSDFQSVADANIIGADNENAAPTIRLVNSFLEYAVNQNASDIHLEPREREMVVRMRIDGVLRKVFNVPRATQSAVIARIKVMGNMNIAEHKIPLDGRSNIRVNDKDVDLRISTLPTVYGEKVVIRLLNKSSSLLNTKGIGLTDKNLKKFNALLENSNGVILIVGPTGSGKSSSMYTMIGQLNTDEVNLVTLEDPVEYNFDGVNQVQINEKTGMTFASGLRSILRQDPDIIAVGEIRDGETADIAMRAAITGHLVLSTIHTSDAAATLDRLFDIGVESYLTASALKGVIAQRLVRKICPHCRKTYTPTDEELDLLGMERTPGLQFYKGEGCPMCFHTGYRGRTGVFEIMLIDRELRRLILAHSDREAILASARKNGFLSLADRCRELVLEGVTSAEEAARTIHSTDD